MIELAATVNIEGRKLSFLGFGYETDLSSDTKFLRPSYKNRYGFQIWSQPFRADKINDRRFVQRQMSINGRELGSPIIDKNYHIQAIVGQSWKPEQASAARINQLVN